MEENKMKTNKNIIVSILTVGLAFLLQSMVFALSNVANQNVTVTVNPMAVLDYSGDVNLTIAGPSIAGNLPDNPFDESTYLRYTVNSAVETANGVISAKLQEATTLGYDLQLHTPSITSGCGTGIESGSKKTLTTTAQDVVTGIGICHTGSGATDGAKLYYNTAMTSLPKVGADNLVVVFTLTAAA